MIIRKARQQDAAAICAVHQSGARKLATGSYSPEQIEAWIGSLTPASYSTVIRECEMLVAEDEGRVIAFGQLDLTKAEIEAVYVSPSVVRRGIGKAILSSLEEIARKHRLPSLHLRATLNAVPFYERAGYFAQAEVSYDTRSGQELRVVSMTKHLSSP